MRDFHSECQALKDLAIKYDRLRMYNTYQSIVKQHNALAHKHNAHNDRKIELLR